DRGPHRGRSCASERGGALGAVLHNGVLLNGTTDCCSDRLPSRSRPLSQLTEDQLDDWAARLREAADAARAIEPLTESVEGLTVADAYAIAQRIVAGRLAD